MRAAGCPFCTRAYKLPNQELIEADERVMMRLNQICATRHPETEVQERCLACIYFRTGLNAIQKHEFAFIVRRIAAHKSLCNNNSNCEHCLRLTQRIFQYYVG
ncbi:uncharacterized protein LOC144652329 [Oculina patagonica]